MNTRLVCLVVLGVLIALGAYAGTTGKIAGKVREAQTGEPVAGVSVLLEGTTIGASTNIDGDFVIVNVPPGTYTVAVSGVGYQKKRYTNVKVSIDFTTRLEAQISSDVISLETVEVQAEAPMVRKDLTSSQTIVDAAAIEALPVESVSQVLTLQAGVVQGADGSLHIRGGRSNEVQYQVNGVSITNPFDNSRTVTIATNAIEELSVVSGTFNAEYGNALSGIVNTVTKEGGGRYHASVSWYTGDKLSTHDDIFLNIADFDPLAIQVAEGTAGGPVPFLEDQVSFFLSGRYDYSRGWYYGLRQHTIYDSVYRSAFDPNDIRIARSGDSALVPMNPSQEYSTTAKLTWTPLAVAPSPKAHV